MSIRRAKETYEKFRESPAKRAQSVRIKLPKVVWIMGHLEAVLYSTTTGGRSELYKHKFTRGSRPLLCAGTKRGQLYIIGGRFRVTDRGIVDLTPKGREIDD